MIMDHAALKRAAAVLERVHRLADKYHLLLPEVHASYGEQVYRAITAKGYTLYGFFLSGLV